MVLLVRKFCWSHGAASYSQDVEFRDSMLEKLIKPDEDLIIMSFIKDDQNPSKVYSEMKEVLDLKSIQLDGKHYYKLGATSSLKRDGSIFYTSSIRLVKEVHKYLAGKKPLQQQCIAYFSNLMTPCQRGITKINAKVLFVEDRVDQGYDTTRSEYGVGDCHGRISLSLHEKLCEIKTEDDSGFMCLPRTATQYRIMGVDVPFLSKGVLSPYDTGEYDLVLPLSGVKGGLIEPGPWEGSLYFGSYIVSEKAVTHFGDQFLRIFPTQVLREAGIYERVAKRVAELTQFQQNLADGTKYLQSYIEDLEEDEYFVFESILKKIDVERDEWFLSHPFVGISVLESLGRKITRAVLGGCLTGDRLLLCPDDSLEFGVISSVHLSDGACIPGKSPIVNHMEQQVMKTAFREDGLIGCAYCSHETASSITSDFDGDQISLLPYSRALGPLFTYVKGMPKLRFVKKEKRPSNKTFSELAVLVFQSTLELYASLLTSVYSNITEYGWLDYYQGLIQELSDKLQVSVDSQKHDPGYDVYEVAQQDLKTYGSLFMGFQKAKKGKGLSAPYSYVSLSTGRQKGNKWVEDVGSIADLIRFANSLWIPAPIEGQIRALSTFQDRFGIPSSKVGPEVASFRSQFRELRVHSNSDFNDLNFARQWAQSHNHDDYFIELWRSLHFHDSLIKEYDNQCWIPKARLVFEAYGDRVLRQKAAQYVIYGAKDESPAGSIVRTILSRKEEAILPVEIKRQDDKYNELMVVGKTESRKLGVVTCDLPVGRYQVIVRLRRVSTGVSSSTLLMEVLS